MFTHSNLVHQEEKKNIENKQKGKKLEPVEAEVANDNRKEVLDRKF